MNMKIRTTYFGEIEIDASHILHFEHGIPGFEDEKQFIVLPIEENSAFQVLQSIQTEALAFIVTDPYAVTIGYSFDLDEASVLALQITDQKEVAILTIVSLKDTLANSTVNLKAPIVINTTNKKAKQVILNNDAYAIRHPLSKESVMR